VAAHLDQEGHRLPALTRPPPRAGAQEPWVRTREPPAARLGMLAGVYNLLWIVVVVLMIVRPGGHS
jgi:hypothetical protein